MPESTSTVFSTITVLELLIEETVSKHKLAASFDARKCLVNSALECKSCKISILDTRYLELVNYEKLVSLLSIYAKYLATDSSARLSDMYYSCCSSISIQSLDHSKRASDVHIASVFLLELCFITEKWKEACKRPIEELDSLYAVCEILYDSSLAASLTIELGELLSKLEQLDYSS